MRPFPSRVALQSLVPSEKRPFSLVWTSLHNNNLPKARYLVLDSSFNPPHLAHRGLCEAACQADTPGQHNLLLLLSTKNVEKIASEKPSFAQKLEMMHAFALDILQNASDGVSVSIGCLVEPTFAGKSSVLLSNLPQGSTLSFILGWE